MKMFDSKSKAIAFKSCGYEGIIEHTHNFVEIIYILNGEGLHIIKGCEIPLKKGDAFVIGTADSHSILPLGDANTFQWANCLIDCSVIEENMYSDIAPEKIAKTLNNQYIQFLVNSLEQEYQNKAPFYQECMIGYTVALIGQIRRSLQFDGEKNDEFLPLENRKDMYIMEAVNYIHENYSEKIKLANIATSIGISQGYLERIFREERTTSPIEYTNIYRIEQACQMLINTDISIYDICLKIGFNDIKNFYQIFKRQIGTSPGAYRRMKQKSDYLMTKDLNVQIHQ